MKNLSVIVLVTLATIACQRPQDAVPDLGLPDRNAQESAPEILSQPLKGQINGKDWVAGSGIAHVVHYADGTDLLKIEFSNQTFSGCTLPFDFGYQGSIEMFAAVELGVLTGSKATVMFNRGEAQGSTYAYDHKVIRIDSIEGDLVTGGMAANKENNDVSGNFTARICP